MDLRSPGSQLIPRKYQEEIFSRAMHENIIAALDTGSGKTYIAVLLMRWLAARSIGPHKVYIFLVPKVPLVEQQRSFIAEQLPLNVRGYHGELVEKWEHDPVRWAQEFNECDVMVMTAQVFLDAMLHAHWSIDKVELIVFDEAHHAKKNHPYNQIMRDFYFPCDLRKRPKVLGMTASPVWNSKQPKRELKELEYNLNAKVVVVLKNQAELLEHSPRPEEAIREYQSQDSYTTYPVSLWDQLVALELFSHPSIVHENLDIRYSVTLAEIGPYGADYYLFSHLSRVVSELARKHHYEYLAIQDGLISTSGSIHGQRTHSDAMSVDSEMTELSSKLIVLGETLEKFCHTVSFDDSLEVELHWLSSKLRVLVSILMERRSTSFQGIIFVEQRQIASTLAWILPRIPGLKGWIMAAALIGHGGRDRTTSFSSTQGLVEKKQRDILNAFRDGSCNLLVSTSVGEEGLDFQACDLIVRFNKIQNMVGYVQSRGRARRSGSEYIVLLPKDSYEDHIQYARMRESEPELREYYENRHLIGDENNQDTDEPEDPIDVALRERYDIPSTGAVLTYGSAIGLLNHLCALIPRDKYTDMLKPTYDVNNFQATVELPAALPIPREQLKHEGALRRSKREAKASAAFAACKALHHLGVFDDYLLPARKTSGAIIQDADGRNVPEVGAVSEMIDAMVIDPWSAWHLPDDPSVISPHAWVHGISFNETQAHVGIVTVNRFEHNVELYCDLGHVRVCSPAKVHWPSEGVETILELLHRFTALGLRWCNTSKLIQTRLTCFLVPLTSEGQPDIGMIKEVVDNPLKKDDIFTHDHENHLVLQNRLEIGRPLILRHLREDLTPLSRPMSSDKPATGEYGSYVELLQDLYGRGKREVYIPTEGPMLLVERFVRNFSSVYPLFPSSVDASKVESGPTKNKQQLLPAGLCEALVLPEYVQRAFRIFPQIVRRITDVFRARAAIPRLGLPPLIDDLVVEALTLPCATAGFNNQRLETLGDSVLKLGVVVYLFNKYPFRHEGQLDGMKTNSVSNRVLLARAKEVGLERFLTCEPSSVRKWRPTTGDGAFVNEVWHAKRKFPRRSLQDCMEALLGASFLAGGMDAALQTGTALELCFGGTAPWGTRYLPRDEMPIPRLFDNLQQDVGYSFNSGLLLIEAVTHPSFQSESACYQRLEFLGDALIDLVVTEFLFKKFPLATSGQLTWARAKSVCAPALATLAVKKLSLHKYLLENRTELGKAISRAVTEHLSLSYEDIVLEGWKYDPPKALSDILESVAGAIFVDTNFDYEKTKGVILKIMDPLLDVLRPDLPRDPTSELMLFLARKGCRRANFERFVSEPGKGTQNDSIRFRVHGAIIGSPLRSVTGLHRAKPLLAQMVKKQLEDQTSQFALESVCSCKTIPAKEVDSRNLSDIKREELDDEVQEEFAVLGILQLQDVDGEREVTPDSDSDSDEDGRQREETR